MLKKFLEPFQALRNRTFSKLYLAQTISLVGDAFTWVGLALLAYELDPARSPTILATALTLRVTTFIVFSPFAGVLADRAERKRILWLTHLARMVVVGCLPFVGAEWQVYLLVFLLNFFNAFFTPTYRAVVPQIVEGKYYREAVGLSTATYQLLGILGPGLAGFVAVWLGARQIFLVDAVSFIAAAVLIWMIPKAALQKGSTENASSDKDWANVWKGIRLLFGNKVLQFALAIEFVSAIAGAQILVNTVQHIKTGLSLGDRHYGWVMAAFGIGAAVAAFAGGIFDRSKSRAPSLIVGAFLLGLAVSFANFTGFALLLVLWLLAGLGQSLAEMPSETLIGEHIAAEDQGKVFGSHFAFSHLWWAIAYPLAGFLGRTASDRTFLYGGMLTLTLAVLSVLIFYRPKSLR
jgi:MFS transporter, NRE family, putaive nickel resistance protein